MPEEELSGAPDSLILERVRAEAPVLLTMDKGIGDIRSNPPEQYAGTVLFRPSATGRGAVLDFVRHHLPDILQLDLARRLLVVTDRAFRLR